MLVLWAAWCWAFGHLENSETIVESVWVGGSENRTMRVEHVSLTCDRCGRWL